MFTAEKIEVENSQIYSLFNHNSSSIAASQFYAKISEASFSEWKQSVSVCRWNQHNQEVKILLLQSDSHIHIGILHIFRVYLNIPA